MLPNIISKLKDICNDESKVFDETLVVYFMTEMRKVIVDERLGVKNQLGREANKTLKRCEIIKFYADWILHSRKNKIPIKNLIINTDNCSLNENFKNGNLLKEKISIFLVTIEARNFTEEQQRWKDFWEKMLEVISEQPMSIEINEEEKLEIQYISGSWEIN